MFTNELRRQRRQIAIAVVSTAFAVPYAAFAAAAVPSTPQAETIEFTFGGRVTSVFDPLDPPRDRVNPEDPWSVTYRFESTTADTDPSPTLGEYSAIRGYTLTIGSASDSASVDPVSFLKRRRAG